LQPEKWICREKTNGAWITFQRHGAAITRKSSPDKDFEDNDPARGREARGMPFLLICSGPPTCRGFTDGPTL